MPSIVDHHFRGALDSRHARQARRKMRDGIRGGHGILVVVLDVDVEVGDGGIDGLETTGQEVAHVLANVTALGRLHCSADGRDLGDAGHLPSFVNLMAYRESPVSDLGWRMSSFVAVDPGDAWIAPLLTVAPLSGDMGACRDVEYERTYVKDGDRTENEVAAVGILGLIPVAAQYVVVPEALLHPRPGHFVDVIG